MMKLTSKIAVPTYLATPFESKNPMPKVLYVEPKRKISALNNFHCVLPLLYVSLFLFAFFQDHLSLALRPPLPEDGPLVEEPASSDPKAPKTVEKRDREEVKNSSERTDLSQSPPLLILKANTEVEKENTKRN
jgi:hypothetical protein